MQRYLGAVAVFLSTLVLSLPSAAFGVLDDRAGDTVPHGASVTFGKRTPAPFGAIVFCQNNPAQCAEQPARVAAVNGLVVLDASTFDAVRTTNAIVNRRMHPQNDPGGVNNDIWQVGQTSGDCEDYALTKRAMLVRLGFPTSAVLLATAEVPGEGRHAVLIVRTTGGDFVLDNLSRSVRPWGTVGYRWSKVQSPDDPAIWLKL